jgi:hypothetical protein
LEGALQEGSEARDKAWRAHERDLETLRGELAEAKAEAAALAADPAGLSDLRRLLRPRMAASPLCDGAGFTRDLELAFQTMWSA